MQATAAIAISGACATGALLLLGTGPAGVVGPLGASVGLGLSARWRGRGVEPGGGPWQVVCPEALGSGAGAAAALALTDAALAGLSVWLVRAVYFGLLGYLVTFAASYSQKRSAGQTLYNLAFSTALWAWLARLAFELGAVEPGVLARPGQAFLQGALLGMLMALPRLGATGAEGKETE